MPLVPAYDCVAAPDDASFDHAVAGEALELLKMFAQSVRVEEGDEFDAVLFGRVQRTCSILERVKVELDPVSFVKMAKQLQARALVHDTGSSAPYRAAFMVKVMCMSGHLRASENLAAMLRHSIGLILPPIVQPIFGLLDLCRKAIPHAGTMSRWRFLLDAAYMQVRPGTNLKNCCEKASI